MVEYLERDLKSLAASRPWLLFKVESRNGPPIIKARYTDNRKITMNVSRMSTQDIRKKIINLVDSRGIEFKPNLPVKPHIFNKAEHWHPFMSSNKFRP